MTRIRFSVRGMMIAVAVAAGVIWLGERSLRFANLARYHEAREARFRQLASVMSKPVGSAVNSSRSCFRCRPVFAPMAKDREIEYLVFASRHRRLAGKYRLAAYLPVMRVATDPVEPVDLPEYE